MMNQIIFGLRKYLKRLDEIVNLAKSKFFQRFITHDKTHFFFVINNKTTIRSFYVLSTNLLCHFKIQKSNIVLILLSNPVKNVIQGIFYYFCTVFIFYLQKGLIVQI